MKDLALDDCIHSETLGSVVFAIYPNFYILGQPACKNGKIYFIQKNYLKFYSYDLKAYTRVFDDFLQKKEFCNERFRSDDSFVHSCNINSAKQLELYIKFLNDDVVCFVQLSHNEVVRCLKILPYVFLIAFCIPEYLKKSISVFFCEILNNENEDKTLHYLKSFSKNDAKLFLSQNNLCCDSSYADIFYQNCVNLLSLFILMYKMSKTF